MPAANTLLRNNPKVQFVQKRIHDTISLAAEKVAGHLLHPQSYPLPPANKKSVETALHDVLIALPKRKRDEFTDRYKTSLNSGQTQRKQKYGDLVSVNLGSNQPVAEQVKNIQVSNDMEFTETEIRELTVHITAGKKRRGPKIPEPRAAVATRLDFIVDSLTANQITDVRKDEINMGAFSIDAAGTEREKEPFFISKFKEGETVSLGAKGNLFSFLLDDGSTGGTFPQTFVAGLFLNEADLIHNKDLARKLTILFVAIGLAAVIAGCIVAAVAPPLMALWLSLILGGGGLFIFGKDLIPFYLIDDFGVPVTDTLTLDNPPAIGETISRTITLNIQGLPGFNTGTYTAQVRWVAS